MFLYPGSGHLFADSSTAEYDAGATDTMLARVLAFLGSH
ncbi:MAG: dienelactone hydrolase family protein [Micrococcaceae bacterium]|nr:dienelactone hydrolase family protein [Micrococcaceae bacterium]